MSVLIASLFNTATCGSLDRTKLLLEYGADVNFMRNGTTPLCSAVRHSKSPDMVKLLLERGADVNFREQDGMTPLHLAVIVSKREDVSFQIASILLDNGADVDLVDDFGDTPLCLAARFTGSVPIAKLLLKHGADFDTPQSPVIIAVECGVSLRMLQFLLDAGADVNSVNADGQTLLSLAALQGKVYMVKLLLERGADVNIADNNGYTPLHFSITRAKSPVMAKLLLDNGADVNFLNTIGNIPLSIAICDAKSFDMVKLLVEHGADVNFIGAFGSNLLECAKLCVLRNKLPEIEALLRSFGFND